MSITALPHHGDFVHIVLNRTVLVFGWGFSGNQVSSPDSITDQGERTWDAHNPSVAALVEAMLQAYRASIKGTSAESTDMLLHASPMVAVHLAAASRFLAADVMRYWFASTAVGQPGIRFPLPATHTLRKDYGVEAILISDSYPGVHVTDKAGNPLTT